MKTKSRVIGFFGRWYNTSLILSIVLLIPTSITRTGLLFPELNVFADLGNAYFQTQQVRLNNNSSIEYLRMIFGPFLFSLLPLTLYYWGKIPKFKRYLAILISVLYLLISFNMGINKLLVDYLIITVVIIIIKKIILVNLKHNIIAFFKRLSILIIVVVFFNQFLLYFQSTQTSRVGESIGEYNMRADIYSDDQSVLVNIFPEQLKVGVIQFQSYISQGYYGLSLAMEEEFTWTYGVGNSIFLLNNFEALFNIEIFSKTYPYKTISSGWDPLITWSSIFPWLASDITFMGTMFILFILGYLLAISLKDLVEKNNYLALPLICQVSIIIIYIPANNQMLQMGESFFTFILTLLLWIFTRRFKII
ncbi:hypothetical protein JOD03_000983 [Chryseomicrobium aureum]|uniref:hypothetical protein n=1 Tax=Chryseomicrobium aureum TaxID=1441723 RepID=UPI0019577E21|nr:hypothetical protein [Chryseomicrobium aureum]MBM7706081.1 hypothetical protein [Chryseomicrobium aureum]